MATPSPVTPRSTPSIAWHTLTPEAALRELASSETGLSQAEAEQRLRIHGPNAIRRKSKDSAWRLLWRQINNSLIWVLLGSGTLAVLLGKMTEDRKSVV